MSHGPLRTLLFTPGNHERRVAKALEAGADAVILDLEDAVAIAEKPAARHAIVEALQRPRSCPAYVRVNAMTTPFCFGDLTTVVGPWLDGIVLPKVEDPGQLATIDWLLGALEREREMRPGAIDLLPLVESASGHGALGAIAAAGTRVRRLAFGAGDYTLDLGIEWTREETELLPVRLEMVRASRAGGLEAPIDTVFLGLDAPDAFAGSCAAVRALGFQGKLVIHPTQVAPANAAFTPSDTEVAFARRVVEAFDAAEAAGAAAIEVDGNFVDYPVAEKARRTLALAEAIAIT